MRFGAGTHRSSSVTAESTCRDRRSLWQSNFLCLKVETLDGGVVLIRAVGGGDKGLAKEEDGVMTWMRNTAPRVTASGKKLVQISFSG